MHFLLTFAKTRRHDRPRRLASLTGEPLGSAESFEFKLEVYAGLFVEVAGR